MESTPELSKSPFHAKDFLNLKPLKNFENKNLLPSNKAVLQRLIRIQEDSKKNTSIKTMAEQIYKELCEITTQMKLK